MPGLQDVATLNGYLADKSFVEGYQLSAADAVVFNAHASEPEGKFVHAVRWWRHVKSWSETERKAFPGAPQSLDSYGPAEGKKAGGEGAAPKKEEKKEAAAADDDDIDLFGSDEEEDEEAEKLKAQRIADYEAKKAKKPAVIAKSSVLIDVKPWTDETDMKAMEEEVRKIEMDGLVWGAAKLQPVAYNIKKLSILCTIEDDKVSTEELEEKIRDLEDYVQSTDIAAFNKI